MRMKEMAKKTRVVATSSEEDDKTDTGMIDRSIRKVCIYQWALQLL